MLNLGSPYTKDEIQAAFAAEHRAVFTFFQEIPLDAFYQAPSGVWTAADNLQHLMQSSEPVVLALRIPKFLLRLRFGKVGRTSQSLTAVRREYTEVALAGGGVASGPYLPNVAETTEAKKQRLLVSWQETGRKLEVMLDKWSEANLDQYAVEHPLLGKQSMRELLFFTLYHNLHHVRDVQQLLGQPLSEWFE